MASAWVKFRNKVTGAFKNVAPKAAHSAIQRELVRGGLDDYSAYNTASNIVGQRINGSEKPYYPPQGYSGDTSQSSAGIPQQTLLIGGAVALGAMVLLSRRR